MSVEVRVPNLPESVADATLVNWHKQPGDPVKRDENLVDLETDKVVLEVPAPADGVLGAILQADGATVKAGDLIATVLAGAEAPAATAPAPAAAPAAAASATVVDLDAMSPAVRRLIAEHGLDPARIPGSGRGGRLTKEDVLAYLAAPKPATAPVAAPTPAPAAPAAPRPAAAPAAAPAGVTPVASPAPGAWPFVQRAEQRVPMTRLRARIAERLLEAKNSTAMLTTFNEINMQPVMDLRNRYKDTFEKTHGVKLGFMSFFVKAVVEALKRYPAVNASIDGNDVVYHGYYDIGIAVSSPRGLVVPILRNAETMGLADVEKAIVDFGRRAKEGTLTVEEMTGGTFTITNGGVFGSLLSTPILNPPQSGILGMHATKERAVVEHGQIVARPMMYVAHSYDHRIIDGREAVGFLVAVKDAIEDPARILLAV
ncbi:2-oxoglutarate dehydrogenase E2 component [Plasticicumulans lactativorans]|uniref:Dihydrolipoyllysine-residue succinyltransferase component of 2-oxoglutarate dehydrogenase complex n=1 Tax=Plasticicumulans lactativorans TaxID=1133106 RepID=A0A4R2L2U1_9GAMM|nr:2-oxoglutarate dehydrogenase complex dihydrolipoyllysine-residue succinyltransferase [Plasticicumulans lactativorans]TCO80804.1 2-oxoglutarate dehydrogenase E2 component [Plasticicumulans lactativorans]